MCVYLSLYITQIAIMASCDVQDTPLNSKSMNSTTSTPAAETKRPTSPPTVPLMSSSIPISVRNHPELVSIKKRNPKISISSTPSKVIKITETSVNGINKTIYQNDIMLQPTKIPAPVGMGKNCRPRKYTTLMKNIKQKVCQETDSYGSTNTLVNLTEDSGIHMDCSGLEDDVAVEESHIIQPMPQVSSETICHLNADERETLRVLQRAVAEMEEDIENRYMEEVEYKEDSQMEDKRTEGEVVEKGNEDEQQLSQLNHQPQAQQEPPPAQPQAQASEQEVPLATDPMCEAEEEKEKEVESSSNRSTQIRERKHVRVEQLLEAEHDIELLQKLLQPNEQLDAPTPDAPLLLEELPQSEQNSSAEVDKILNSLDDDADDRSDNALNQVGLLYSLLNIFCGKSIRKLSCPVLLCGLAVGLIFYFRKV